MQVKIIEEYILRILHVSSTGYEIRVCYSESLLFPLTLRLTLTLTLTLILTLTLTQMLALLTEHCHNFQL